MAKVFTISEENKTMVLKQIGLKADMVVSSFEDLVSIAPLSVRERLNALKSFKENPQWHPEGNTYDHIKTVATRLMLTGNINMILAALYHDLGKFDVGVLKEGKDYMKTPGHEHKSAKMVKRDSQFIEWLGGDVDEIHTLVSQHMRYKQMSQMRPPKQATMRAMPTFPKQAVFGAADNMLQEFTEQNIYKS